MFSEFFGGWGSSDFTGEVSSGRVGRAATIESLEGRTLLSADLINFDAIATGAGLTDTATDLGSFQVKSKKSVKGSVGVGKTDVLYKINVTQPLNLKVTLSKLKQTDELQILFADGSPINAGWTSGKASSIKISQRLDAGVYYVDVIHGFRGQADAEVGGGGFGAAKVKKYKFKPVDAFSLSLNGVAPDATTIAPVAPVVQTKFSSAFGSTGASAQPTISAQLAADSGFFQYSDFSGSPLWAPSGPSPDDVKQGAIGDCYFMASISSLARTNPGLIAESIVPQANGKYLIRFFSNGQEFDQQIDAKLPANQAGAPVFAQPPASGAIWPALLEKAWCLFRPTSNDPGSYDGIDLGYASEALKAFGSTDATDIGPYTFRTAPQFLQQISDWTQAGKTVMYGTTQPRGVFRENQFASGLFSGHEYSIVSVDVANNKITFRNPWATNTFVAGDDGTSGYITVTGDQALQVLGGIAFGTVPIVNTTIDPNPTPSPTPTPTISDGIPGNLGVDSFQTDSGSNYDVYTFTATSSGEAGVLIETNAFLPQLLIAEPGFDGDLQVVATDSNENGLDAAYVVFTAVEGTTYKMGIFAGGTDDTGAYRIKLSNNLANLAQITPGSNPSATTGSISGYVYEDANANGTFDNSEAGSENWTVYLDYDLDGVLDSDEPSALTDSTGQYFFSDLPPDTYVVRVVPEQGWTQTEPEGESVGLYAIVEAGEEAQVSDFGMVFASGGLSGIVYYDTNGNGVQDTFEVGAAGFAVYIDVGNRGAYVNGDPYMYTDSDGHYSFEGLDSGTYVLRVYRENGYTVTEGANGWAPVAVGGQDVFGGAFGEFYTG